MSVAAKNIDTGLCQWVTFSLGDEVYGIDVMRVQEVLRVTEIAPVPGAPHFVLGIVNLRGNVVTVVDTRTLFALPSREADDTSRIVIIESNQVVIGILVDSVAEVVEIERDAIELAPHVGNEEGSRYIQGVHSHDGRLYILIDLDKLLTEEEWSGMVGF